MVEPEPHIIEVHDDDSLKQWAERLNTTEDELKAAVEKMGPNAVMVELYLRAPSP